eukprot:TRINITY_DN80505_c0_g1_i1.p1 TRINITY_DN80505_c0_g1~~TRINITY_DN80505_c0_g1_i1.p1  ORF type:complete len:186 (+),score=62.17 TRINITY_DN80505_c0_g1_i1:97-654(+)
MDPIKIVMLGAGGVGKTALTIQLTQNIFEEEYNPTIEDTYRKELTIDGKKYMLNILDTAGQEEYAVLRDQYWRSGDGFVLVYDITDATSFEEVKDARKQILRAKELDSFPMIVVGNKVDLEDQRDIEASEVQKWCEEMGCPFMETSAKKRINVMESFEIVVKDLLLFSSTKGKKKKKSGWKFWKS